VVAIKVCQGDIYMMYCNQTSNFTTENFWISNHYWSSSMRTSRCSGYLTWILVFKIWPLRQMAYISR
jgi:hypothetical protein